MFAWPPEYTLGKPTDAATSSRCTANASKSICQPPPNSSRFSLEQYNEVCEMLQGVKSNNAQGNRNLSLAAVSAYLKLPHLKTILKMHNIIGYNSGTKQVLWRRGLVCMRCDHPFSHPFSYPLTRWYRRCSRRSCSTSSATDTMHHQCARQSRLMTCPHWGGCRTSPRRIPPPRQRRQPHHPRPPHPQYPCKARALQSASKRPWSLMGRGA